VNRVSILVELFRMVWEHRSWMLLPPLVALILVGGLIALGQVTPLGPLVYPLF